MSEVLSPIPKPSRPRPVKGVPRSLVALANIASTLATRDSIGAVMPRLLGAVASELDGTEASLWLAEETGLRRAWTVGSDPTSREAVERRFRGDEVGAVDDDDFVIGRLVAGRTELGALSLRPGREMSGADRTFLDAVADLLAPALRDADTHRRLESEVAARRREIDEQHLLTEKIIDSLPVGLYVIDREYRIQAWNHKRETGLQGVARDAALGRTIFDVLHRQPAEVLRQEFESVFETGQMQQFTIESTAFGEPRTYRLTKIPMQLGGAAVSHVITIGEDITEWRQAEMRFSQAEKLAAIGTLAAGVMHEINNPLATIGACAESLVLGLDEKTLNVAGDAPELRDALTLIQNEVYRCKGITDGLLDFSRPKSTDKLPVDLNMVVEKTLRLAKHHPRFRRAVVDVDAGQRLPVVRANEEQLMQVFMALLLNAVDAMDGAGTIVVRTRSGDSRESAVAEVVDCGHGIRGADRTKIFEPFYTTKGPSHGTGLGLSICYSIVREHGGRIEVESVVGEGSTFRILLPSAKA